MMLEFSFHLFVILASRVKFGHNVFINNSVILSASGGIEFEDGVMLALGV